MKKIWWILIILAILLGVGFVLTRTVFNNATDGIISLIVPYLN